MNFENIPPKWDAAGTEPSEELKTTGFTAGYKPPAAYFNYLFNRIVAAVKEVQEKFITHADNKKNPHGVTAEQLKAVPLDGSKPMTGDLVIEKNYPFIRLNHLRGESGVVYGSHNNIARIMSQNTFNDEENMRTLELYNSEGKSDIADALCMVDIVEGVHSTYKIYGEHNPQACDNNILINSNFANPVNQRAYESGTVLTGNKYTLDRWLVTLGGKLTVDSGNNVKLEMTTDNNSGQCWLSQRLEWTSSLAFKTVTLSAKINGEIYKTTATLNKTNGVQGKAVGISKTFDLYVDYNSTTNVYAVNIGVYKGNQVTIEWVKLEYGDHATPYVPRLYAEEVELCQRFYQSFKTMITAYTTINANAVIVLNYNYNVGMRATPTVVNSTIKTSAYADVGGSFSEISKDSGGINFIKYSKNLSAGYYYCWFTLDAEL